MTTRKKIPIRVIQPELGEAPPSPVMPVDEAPPPVADAPPPAPPTPAAAPPARGGGGGGGAPREHSDGDSDSDSANTNTNNAPWGGSTCTWYSTPCHPRAP
ncbi:MAG: hypothetical protein ACK4WK_09700, partial [Anaerolineae bacterium]